MRKKKLESIFLAESQYQNCLISTLCPSLIKLKSNVFPLTLF